MRNLLAGSDESVRRTASDWVALVHDPDSAVDRAAFERWRSADPRHGIAYARAERAWDQAALLARTSVGRAPRRLDDDHRPARWASRPALAAAAMIVIIVTALALAVWRPISSGMPSEQLAEAARTGEIRKVALADGSIVTLDTDSVVRVRFGLTERRLVLVRGRARFEVARDPARPFVVAAGAGLVTARGTAFDVSVVGNNVTVAMLRGAAEVRCEAASINVRSAIVLRLTAGRQLSFGAAGPAPRTNALAVGADRWTSGMLSFDGTRLGDAVIAANRYSAAKIIVADASLNELRVTGAYRVGDIQGLAASLAASLRLRALRTPRGDVVILSASAKR